MHKTSPVREEKGPGDSFGDENFTKREYKGGMLFFTTNWFIII